jgi:hypothetical protein
MSRCRADARLAGLLTAFATVQVPMLAAMVRSRAQLHKYLIAPAVAAPLDADDRPRDVADKPGAAEHRLRRA